MVAEGGHDVACWAAGRGAKGAGSKHAGLRLPGSDRDCPELIEGQRHQLSQAMGKINTPSTCGSDSILQHRTYYFQLKPAIIS